MPTFMNLPAYSIGNALDTSPLSNAVDSFGNALKENRVRQQDMAIGNALAKGRYGDAAAEAARVGKPIDVVLGIKKYASSEASAADERQQKLIARMAGLAQDALDEKDPARQADKFKRFMAIQGVTNALPEAYRADPRSALGYVVSSARGYQDPLDRRLKEAQIEELGKRHGDTNKAGLDPTSGIFYNQKTGARLPVPALPRSKEDGSFTLGEGQTRFAPVIGPDGKPQLTEVARGGARRKLMNIDGRLVDAETGQPVADYRDPVDSEMKAEQLKRLKDEEARNRRLAEYQNELKFTYEKRLAEAKSEIERNDILAKAKALGLDLSAPTATPSPAVAPSRAAVPTDPYMQITQPAISPQQEEAERRRRAATTAITGDLKGAGKIMAKDEDPKEYQTKDALFAERMGRSEITLRGITGSDSKKYNPGQMANKWWFDDSVFNSQNWRSYQATAREWIAAMLRKDTGASVTPAEWELYFPTYFPQPNDGLEVQKQKLDRRIQAARGLRASSGPAFDRMHPNFDAEMRQRLREQSPSKYGEKAEENPYSGWSDDEIKRQLGIQ